MALTPKNWDSFQHYKDRSPAWIKLHRGLLDNFEFHRLPVASKALAPMLWLLASEYENGEITASIEEIAFRFRMPIGDLKGAIKPLIDLGFFVASDVLADCKRRACLEEDTNTRKEEEIEADSRSIADASRPSAVGKFEEFWKAYPRRDGPNPRKPAEQKFNALVKSGVDPDLMIQAARQLDVDEGRRGNIGTRFVPQALTWLGQQRWTDHAAVTASPDAPIDWDNVLSFYKRTGHWSKHAGNDPTSPGCRAPPDLLAKYEIRTPGALQ
jgi:hypothetical protein